MLLLQSLPLINNKKVLAITLARGGSKGVPHKNIRPLAGKPLLQYTTQAVLNSSYIDHYVVSTDDPDIQSLSISLGAESPFLRSQLTLAIPLLQQMLLSRPLVVMKNLHLLDLIYY